MVLLKISGFARARACIRSYGLFTLLRRCSCLCTVIILKELGHDERGALRSLKISCRRIFRSFCLIFSPFLSSVSLFPFSFPFFLFVFIPCMVSSVLFFPPLFPSIFLSPSIRLSPSAGKLTAVSSASCVLSREYG